MQDDELLLSMSPAPGDLADRTEEEDLSMSDSEMQTQSLQPNVCIGDTVCFRAVHRKTYINLDDESSGIVWQTESDSSMFTIYPAVGQPGSAQKQDILDGAVVCLFAPNGYFLSFDGERLAANRPYYVAGPSAEFIVHIESAAALRHRGKLFLRNRASQRLLEVDQERLIEGDTSPRHGGDTSPSHSVDGSEPGCLLVQKVFEKHAQTATPPRKVRRRSRFSLVATKSPRFSRRRLQECANLCRQPAFKKFLARSALAVSVP